MTEESVSIDFDIHTIDATKRTIEGIAHIPTIDGENEMIIHSALQKALKWFMVLPGVHIQHTERLGGLVQKAWIPDGTEEFHVRVGIKPTPDCDDIWERIEQGHIKKANGTPMTGTELFKFSIMGRRLEYSDSCRIPAGQRTSPCITKSIYLDSISLCGDNAVNSLTSFDIVKGFSQAFNAEELPGNGFALNSDLKPTAKECLLEEVHKVQASLTDLQRTFMPDANTEIKTGEVNPDGVIQKAETVQTETKAQESPDFSAIIKAAFAENIGEFSKAQTDAITEITKAQTVLIDGVKEEFKKSLSTLEERLNKIEEQKIEKGGVTMILGADGKALDLNDIEDGAISNAQMIKKALGRF